MAGSSLFQTTGPVPSGITYIPGPAGDDGYEVPIQTVAASGAVTLDYSLGRHVVLNLVGNVSSISVSNWPDTGNLARLSIEVRNTGAYDISAWPAGTKWAFGAPPTITPGAGKIDVVALTTTDAGSSLVGYFIGKDFS